MNILDKIAKVDDGHEISVEEVLEALHRGLHNRYSLTNEDLIETMLLLVRLAKAKH